MGRGYPLRLRVPRRGPLPGLVAVIALAAFAGAALAGRGACCLDDGSCRTLTPETCEKFGGEYQGDDVSCLDIECHTGACCLPDGSCAERGQLDCVVGGGLPRGGGTLCADAACPRLVWDNDIDPNGFNGRAISPPAFPQIRVADDFEVPEGEIWRVQAVGVFVLEDNEWERGERLTVHLYDDADGVPAAEIAALTGAYSRTRYHLKCSFDRDCFTYWLDTRARLPAGRYWLGPRNPDGAGKGTNYWLTSDGGDGTDRTAWFSLDGGATWMPEGDDWHHAFEVRGVVETCPADADDSGAVDFDDLLDVLSAWGPYAPCPPLRPEDANADCEVGFDDVLAVLGAWGPCPASP